MTAQMTSDAPIDIGDIVPRWPLKRRNGQPFDVHADEESGHFHVLIFARSAEAGAEALAGFTRERDAFDALGARVRLVVPADIPGEFPFPLIIDADGTGGQLAGLVRSADDGFSVLIVGPNQHLLARFGPEDGDPADACLARIRPVADGRRADGVPAMHPPVLIVPDVMNEADCQRLINIYALQGQEFVEPGHNQLEGRTTDCKMRIPEYGRNDRIDHWVCSQQTNGFIDSRIGPRLIPEIQRAFNYKVTRHERYRIACYEGARGGSKHGHRDNTLPFVAHRRFAVTINLNSDDYEGAELAFPEFSEATYKPPAGAAIVFSCSLLHEVQAMRSGRRFALLAFLFGET